MLRYILMSAWKVTQSNRNSLSIYCINGGTVLSVTIMCWICFTLVLLTFTEEMYTEIPSGLHYEKGSLSNKGSLSTCLLAIYADGKGEIRVRNVEKRYLIKTFKIQVQDVSGGLAIDYAGDVMLFADKERIFKIYLVDKVGKRRRTGKGELFTDSFNEHFEVILWPRQRFIIGGLSFDQTSKKFYVFIITKIGIDSYWNKIYEIIPDTGHVTGVVGVTSSHKPAGNLIMHKGEAYVSVADPYYIYSKKSLFQFHVKPTPAPTPTPTPPQLQRLIYGQPVDISAFTIDNATNRLFFTQRSSIQVVDANVTDYRQSPFGAMNKVKVVIADSSVTNGLEGIAVYGNIVIWSSGKLKRLYIGEIGNSGNFIQRENVYPFDGSENDEVVSRYIIIYKHNTTDHGIIDVQG